MYNTLVARANHRCWALLLIPGSSDCSDAETDPQGYSAPTPIPIKKLNDWREHYARHDEPDLPHGTQHTQHSTYAPMCARRCRR